MKTILTTRLHGRVVKQICIDDRPLPFEAALCGLRSSPAFATSRDHLELQVWRLLGEDLAPYVDCMLASLGDHAAPELVHLQHRLTELRNLRPAAPAVATPFPRPD